MTMIRADKGAEVGDGAVAAIAPFGSLTAKALSSIRQIYEAVPATRETLGVLFAVDAAQTNPTEAWTGFFVETACAQLIWDERPTGTLTADAAAWVLARFDEAPSLAVLAVLVRLVEEAQRVPAHFAADVRQRAQLFTDRGDKDAQARRAPVPYLRLVA